MAPENPCPRRRAGMFSRWNICRRTTTSCGRATSAGPNRSRLFAEGGRGGARRRPSRRPPDAKTSPAFDTTGRVRASADRSLPCASLTRHADLARASPPWPTRSPAAASRLVHGDCQPEEHPVRPRGPVFLDAECAWYGDPAFDLAFCLNHLLLKCVWRPDARRSAHGALAALSARLSATASTGSRRGDRGARGGAAARR